MGEAAAEAARGDRLHGRYLETRVLADLEQAVACWERAAADSRNPSRARYLGTAASGLRDLYSYTGHLEQLERAIRLHEQAMALEWSDSDFVAEQLNNLSNALSDYFEHTGKPDDLSAAVTAAEGAVRLVPQDSPDRPLYLSTLGSRYFIRYEQLAGREDLERAMRCFAQAAALCPPESAELPGCLNGLGVALMARAEIAADRADLDRAIENLMAAAELGSPRLPAVPGIWTNLGNALAKRGGAGDVVAANAAFRYACQRAQDLDMSPFVLGTAQNWGGFAAELGHWERAAEACRLGLEAADRLFRSHATRDHREAWLAKAEPIAREAPYVLARAGDATEAALALEGFRARLVTGMVADVRTAGDQLNAVGRYAPDITDLAVGTATSPLVYVLASNWGGLALLVRADTPAAVEALWLPRLSLSELAEHVASYGRAYGARASDRRQWSIAFDQITRWLWDAAMGLIIDAIAPATQLTLVAAGLLGLLPLHAAWKEDLSTRTGRRYAIDDTLITYAANARMLAAARSAIAAISPDSVFVVGPSAWDRERLTGAEIEARQVLAAFGGSGRLLIGDEATSEAVSERLTGFPVLHFACEGRADLSNPLNSRLHHLLAVRDIFGKDLHSVRLAVLSGCETSMPGTPLLDEVVTLPTAFAEAGIPGVVGTLTTVPDLSTLILMLRFYEGWRRERLAPPEALRQAQRWVRDSTNGEKHDRYPYVEQLSGASVPASARGLWETARGHTSPVHWAPFVYVGT